MIVVESGLKGGTYEAGAFALKAKVPLFVAEYAQPSDSAAGNAYFIQHSATPIWHSRETQDVGLKRLFDGILSHYDNLKQPAAPAVVQGNLFAMGM